MNRCRSSIIALITFFASLAVFAESLQYPELHVSPLASERLKLEAERPSGGIVSTHKYFQLSAATTLVTSLAAGEGEGLSTQEKDDFDGAKTVGMMVGAGWLVGLFLMDHYYKPYQEGMSRISSLPGKTKKDRLVRERMAEEALAAPSSFIKKMKWISAISNLGASALVASSDASDSSRILSGLSGVVAILPLIFKHPWQHAYDQHLLYKKKIYGPIFSTGLLKNPDSNGYEPGITATINF